MSGGEIMEILGTATLVMCGIVAGVIAIDWIVEKLK